MPNIVSENCIELISDLHFSQANPILLVKSLSGRISAYDAMKGISVAEDEITNGFTLESQVLASFKQYNAMLISRPRFAGLCIEKGLHVPAMLNDFVHAIGSDAKISEYNFDSIRKILRHSNAVMIRDGTVITCGKSEQDAYTSLAVLESEAEILLKAPVVGDPKPLSRLNITLERLLDSIKRPKRRVNKKLPAANDYNCSKQKLNDIYGHDSVCGKSEIDIANDKKNIFISDHEIEIRKLIVEYANKMVDLNMLRGSDGNISVRLDNKYMLCTPSGRDYRTLKSDETVKVNIKTLEYQGDLRPTSEKALHASIYLAYPEAGAIIHTHSKYCCMYAVCEQSLRPEPNGQTIFLCAKYAFGGTRKLAANTVAALSDSYGAFLSHHGMIAYGKNLAEAVDRADLMEDTARSIINTSWRP